MKTQKKITKNIITFLLVKLILITNLKLENILY